MRNLAALLAKIQDAAFKYDTGIPDEPKFQGWLAQQSKATGKDRSRDLEDYDLRGFYSENPGEGMGSGHMTDRYKKPNHPTFSDESKYSGVNGNVGGHWGPDYFMPSPQMLSSTHDLDELVDHFQNAPKGDPDRDYRVRLPPYDLSQKKRR